MSSSGPVFPSEEWAKRLCEAASRDQYLAEIGRGITETIIVAVRDTGEALFFEVRDGRCVEARKAAREDWDRASLVLEADLGTWLDMLCWRLSPTTAYFRRRLRIRKGSLRLLLARPLLNYQLYYLASRVSPPGMCGQRGRA